MQGCTDPVFENVGARSAQHQASATAQNGEAEVLEARGRRKGAATRLDMDVNMTASGSGATLPVGGDDAARYVDSNAAEGAPAQFMPESVARAEGGGGSDFEARCKKAEIALGVHAGDWSLDDWLTEHRCPEECPGVEVDKTNNTYKANNVLRRADFLLTPSVLPVKIGLMKMVPFKEWKKGSLHEQMLEIKGFGRALAHEYSPP